jgi:hypothetical protein
MMGNTQVVFGDCLGKRLVLPEDHILNLFPKKVPETQT